MSLEKLLSRTAQQLLCACISAAVRMSISCCALVIHLLCGKFIYRNASAFFVYVANLFKSSKELHISINLQFLFDAIFRNRCFGNGGFECKGNKNT